MKDDHSDGLITTIVVWHFQFNGHNTPQNTTNVIAWVESVHLEGDREASRFILSTPEPPEREMSGKVIHLILLILFLSQFIIIGIDPLNRYFYVVNYSLMNSEDRVIVMSPLTSRQYFHVFPFPNSPIRPFRWKQTVCR